MGIIAKTATKVGDSASSFIREQMELMQKVADKAENRKNDWSKLEEFFRSAVL